jgi:hypothetical protein
MNLCFVMVIKLVCLNSSQVFSYQKHICVMLKMLLEGEMNLS